jgi:PhnB protein
MGVHTKGVTLMSSRLNPYIRFSDGVARQALEFYHDVFGGTLTTNTFGEFGMSDSPAADQIMHGMLETDLGFTLMGADTPPGMGQHTRGDSIALSVSGGDTDLLRGYWKQLSDGGSVVTPLETQVWGDEYGECVDKFGVIWMVNITQPQG